MLTANIIGGILIVYLIGVPYQAFVTHVTVAQALVPSLTFFLGDLIKVIIVSLRFKSSRPHTNNTKGLITFGIIGMRKIRQQMYRIVESTSVFGT